MLPSLYLSQTKSPIFKHLFNRSCGGIDEIARESGIGSKLELRLGRLDAAGERTSITTDSQMELEMPTIRNYVDKLQGDVFFLFPPQGWDCPLAFCSLHCTVICKASSFGFVDYIVHVRHNATYKD